MDPGSITERRYREGDGSRIVSLFKEVYGHSRSLEHWKWKFTRNLMKRPFIWVAEDTTGRMIAHYAVCPVPMDIGGRRVMAAQSLDTMVVRDFQRRGLMISLAGRCYKDAADAGIEIVYGYPNKRSFYPLVKGLGFRDLGQIRRYELTFSCLSSLPSLPTVRSSMIVRSVADRLDRIFHRQEEVGPAGAVEDPDRFDSAYEDLWKRANDGRNSVTRGPDYLNWRYREFPDRPYLSLSLKKANTVHGFGIFSSKGYTGFIAELVPLEDEPARALIGTAIPFFRKEGIGRLVGYFRPNDSERQVLKDLGFVERSSELSLCIKYLREGPPGGLFCGSSWYTAFGDTDGI